MKFVLITGNSAVGKMTVGQELAKRTGLRLFHNHMTIEPVLEIFGFFHRNTVMRLREVVFEEFDQQGVWDYIEHVRQIFEPYGTQFYCVELVASQQTRMERNRTENRLQNKASKRDIAGSDQRLLHDDACYRLESFEGEIPFVNYMKIDNTDLSPDAAAKMIQEKFML